ncbi:Dual specificity protein phosphatase 23 [Papilio xuthus]|uniref:Dual specificity protein phosphatase 23 n=1 Tax=Papilio xuthus TaxID=66420 RepID=A0A194Q5A9_PAPXU|nr:Dual specificity protein phosphatase 23 [Papilio xuthus]
MGTVPKRTNVKLAKLFYKYADTAVKEETEEIKELKPAEEKKERESYPPYNFSWFLKGKVAAMGWPQTIENLNYLVDSGINHLITLSPEKLPPIYDFDRKLKWTEIGIKEFGAPTLKQIIKFIEICERADINGEVIGIHCRHGRGRTGTMLACYLVHFKNMAPERAVLTVRVQRPGSCETYEQEKIVCHYHDCVRGTITKPDYRLVDDKVYFDCSMKYTYPDEEDIKKEEIQSDTNVPELTFEKLDVAEIIERHSKEKKSKAMVINHKIYF